MTNPYLSAYCLNDLYFYSIITISLNTFVTSILYGLVTFGDNIIFFIVHETLNHFAPQLTTIPGVKPENQLRSLIFLLAIRSLSQNMLAVKLIFKEAKWEILKYAAPAASIFCVLGCYFLDLFANTVWMRPLLGVVFAIFGTITLVIRIRKSMKRKERQKELDDEQQRKQQLEEPSSPPTSYIHPARTEFPKTIEQEEEAKQNAKLNDSEYLKQVSPWLIGACCVSGWLGGSINVSGPPFIVVSLLLEFPRGLARATFPLVALTTYITRVLYTLISGSFFDPELFSVQHAIGVVSGALIGLYIGDSLGRIVTNEQYLQIASILLLCAGLSIGGASVWISWLFLSACSVWFVWSNKK